MKGTLPMQLFTVVLLICFAGALSGCASMSRPLPYGAAPTYFDPYHPCPLNGNPDLACNRQNPWPHGA